MYKAGSLSTTFTSKNYSATFLLIQKGQFTMFVSNHISTLNKDLHFILGEYRKTRKTPISINR